MTIFQHKARHTEEEADTNCKKVQNQCGNGELWAMMYSQFNSLDVVPALPHSSPTGLVGRAEFLACNER